MDVCQCYSGVGIVWVFVGEQFDCFVEEVEFGFYCIGEQVVGGLVDLVVVC